jgi:multimeric flavodoxin WrbA
MGKKILGIVGSYRKGGVIDSAVSEVLNAAAEGGAEVEKIHLLDKRIEFCTNCRRCTQTEGPEPGACIHDDDMPGLIAAIEEAGAIVFGAPVNFGGVNALTQRFLERLVCYSWWPWGEPAPKLRKGKRPTKKAVLITSSAMPAIMGRFCTGSMKSLKKGSAVVGAKPVATLYVGLAAGSERLALSGRMVSRARRAGGKLSTPS